MPNRPERPQAVDELGLTKTLPGGPETFAQLCGQGPGVLLLGLGPEPQRLPEFFSGQGPLRYVECPDLAAQLGPRWREAIPEGLLEVPPQEAAALALQGAKVLLYAPGPRLFPSFWGPVLAGVQVALLGRGLGPRTRLAWLPGGPGSLLRVELAEALEALGFAVRTEGCASLPEIRALLAQGECPELFLSVNFSGLDPLGESAHLLAAAGARLAVWCVDNPLHLVSGLRSRFWTALPLFVTDDWFIEPLTRLGAEHVRHLALAARASDLERPHAPAAPAAEDLSERLLFAGRSAFPGKEGFFAGCRLPEGAWAEALGRLPAGDRADFGWWLGRLGVARLWPGPEVRQAGFCAEETGRAWRALCLTVAQQALGPDLTVLGDEGWRLLLPQGTDIRPPADYYGAMPGLAAAACCCLNCTSPLLPRGLTQRHFDAWAWGGALLTDATPGLCIFPAELVREIVFLSPAELPRRFRALRADPALRRELMAAWRAELIRAHTYAHRLANVLEALGLA